MALCRNEPEMQGSRTSLFLKPFQMYFVSSPEANVLSMQMQRKCKIQTNDIAIVYVLKISE